MELKQSIIVREEAPTDYPSVYQVNQRAFGRADEADLVERLRMSDAYLPDLSLVAEGEHIVGHILFSRIQIEGAEVSPSLALAPMAVDPAVQRSGVGHLLVKAGLAKAKVLGHTSVIVLGHTTYYPRFGFLPASKWDIKCPFEVPDEAFMALELRPGALSGKSGIVRYSQAFRI